MELSWKQTTWYVFHKFTLEFYPEELEHYKNFFNSFKTILPCEICLNHYNIQLNRPGLMLNENLNKDNIFGWTIKIHNNVNISHKKKEWNILEAQNYYSSSTIDPSYIKIMVLELVRTNFKKGPLKTNELFNMLNSMRYIYPIKEIKDKLLNMNSGPTHQNMKEWLLEFLKIIYSK